MELPDGCPYSATKNYSPTAMRSSWDAPSSPSTSKSLPPSVYLSLKPYPCRKGRTRRRSRWLHVLQAALSKRCSPSGRMWHWHLGQHRPTSPSGRRDDPVDHSAMSSRQATRICPCHHWEPWQHDNRHRRPAAYNWWWWCQLHRDRRRRHLCCQLSPHTPDWTYIEDGIGHACCVCYNSERDIGHPVREDRSLPRYSEEPSSPAHRSSAWQSRRSCP